MCICFQRHDFINYINQQQPVYIGTDTFGNPVRVKLVQWNSKTSYGLGEIKPYADPTATKNEKRDLSCEEPQNKICQIQVHKRTITFIDDNHKVFFKVIALPNFEKLEMVSLISKTNLGTLHLQKTTTRDVIT